MIRHLRCLPAGKLANQLLKIKQILSIYRVAFLGLALAELRKTIQPDLFKSCRVVAYKVIEYFSAQRRSQHVPFSGRRPAFAGERYGWLRRMEKAL
jgi:hypothetical protein